MAKMIKFFLLTTFAGSLLFFSPELMAQCKVKPIVKQCMPALGEFQYDSYVVKEIKYDSKAKKETLDFEVFSEEQYKLVFGQTTLPQVVGITIYGLEKGKKKILYFDESGKKSSQDFNFSATKSGTYYIEYDIPAATTPGQKGCFVLLIGIKDL
jgi:hypothetical protein